jgi:hypothetical protein
VHIDGPVGVVTGLCPNLAFVVRAQPVTTDSSTKFDNGTCTSVRTGVSVGVDGTSVIGVVRATRVTINKNDDV